MVHREDRGPAPGHAPGALDAQVEPPPERPPAERLREALQASDRRGHAGARVLPAHLTHEREEPPHGRRAVDLRDPEIHPELPLEREGELRERERVEAELRQPDRGVELGPGRRIPGQLGDELARPLDAPIHAGSVRPWRRRPARPPTGPAHDGHVISRPKGRTMLDSAT